MRSHRGFSLLEVIVIVAVLAALTAFIVPTLAATVVSDNERATREQAEEIYTAIFGDASSGGFGYFGDMGRLPTSLDELVTQGTEQQQPTWHTADGGVDHVGKVGTGWRGPYLRDFFSTSDLLTDAWGRPFSFSSGQITSGGPDGQTSTTADNIVYPAYAPPSTGTAHISLLTNRIPDAPGATVKFYSTVNGEQVAGTTTKNLITNTSFDGFSFSSLAHGLHIIRLQHTALNTTTNQCVTVTRYVPIAVYAGQQVVRDIRMVSSADVKITENTCTIPD